MESPTQYAELNEVLDGLVTGARELLGANFVGAYLQGSFALGDGDAFSDADFVIVTAEDVPSGVVPELDTFHTSLHGRQETWAQHLEGSYAPLSILRRSPRLVAAGRNGAWRDPETGMAAQGYPMLFLGNGSRTLVRSEHDDTNVVRWILRERGVVLAGPSPAQFMEAVPRGALRAEASGVLRHLGESVLDGSVPIDALWIQGFVVLALCRMLRTVVSGDVVSKPAAVAWACAVLDPRWAPLVERAWAQRSRYPRGHGAPEAHAALAPDPAAITETLAFVRMVLDLERDRAPFRA